MCVSLDSFRRKAEVCMDVVLLSSVIPDFACWTAFPFRKVSHVHCSSERTNHLPSCRARLTENFIGTLGWVRIRQTSRTPRAMRLAIVHTLPKGLSWPSCHLIQASQVAQEGSILIFWTVSGHKPSWSPPSPPFVQFSLPPVVPTTWISYESSGSPQSMQCGLSGLFWGQLG